MLRERCRDRPLLCLPTGGGKTSVAAEIIRAAVARGNRCIFLVHRRELVDQAVERLAEFGVKAGRILAGHYEVRSLPVQVACIPTLVRRKHWPAELVIVDECAHATSRSWTDVIGRYPDSFVIGLTATPIRLDGKGLGDIFGCIVEPVSTRALIEQGHLIEPKVFAPPVDLGGIPVKRGDYSIPELAVRMEKLTGSITKEWLGHARGMKTVAFAVNVEHSQKIVAAFREIGVRAAHIDGGTANHVRAEALRRLRAGDLDLVSNCMVLSEGWDLPSLRCAILARPTKSLALFRQCLDAETEILTQAGWRSANTIQADDSAACMDIEAVSEIPSLRWSPVLSVVDRQLASGEEMFGIESPTMSVRVTAEHRMVAKHRIWCGGRNAYGAWSTETAGKLATRASGARLPAAGTMDFPGIELTDDELRFVGWFLTDGWINKKTNSIGICQSIEQPHIGEIAKMLHGCGFKFGVYEREPSGFANGKRQRQYTVSKGKPRGTGKHLRGWGALERFIDKDIAPDLMKMTARQFAVFIEAIHLGDGSKQLGQTWTRRSYHITTARPVFADRLQRMAILRGWRCSIASSENRNGNQILFVHLRQVAYRALGGRTNGDARKVFASCPAISGERVWCIETESGTIITRRHGKVAILGNCVGRVMRPPGPVVVLDHAGNHHEHGVVTSDYAWSLTDKPKRHPSDVAEPVRTCHKCFAVLPPTVTTCPECGTVCGAREQADPPGVENPGVLIEFEAPKRLGKEAEREWYVGVVRNASETHRSLGWAKHRFKETFGAWPRHKDVETEHYVCPGCAWERKQLGPREVMRCKNCYDIRAPGEVPESMANGDGTGETWPNAQP